jgi:hypothetical protein
MSILDALKFVQGAVSKKDFVPALAHFLIKDGRVMGYDGSLCLSSPIDLDLDCCPKAAPFVAAVQACTETAQLNMTAAGRLAIRSGKFKASVECLPPEQYPGSEPEGQPVAITGDVLPALATLYEFTAEDASRPWAAGVLLDGCSAYATNNVVLVEHWLGFHFPFRVNVPRTTVREMLRIGEEPVGLQLTHNSLTLHYSGERWMRSQLNSTEWPDAVSLLANMAPPEGCPAVPEGLFEALATLLPFLGPLSQVQLGEEGVATADGAASVAVEGLPAGSFNARMLALLQGHAAQLGLACWPQPVPFYGPGLRGLIAGMRA